MQTPPQIIIVSNTSQSEWLLSMTKGLSSLGDVQVLSENDAFMLVRASLSKRLLVIADASAIKKNMTAYVSQLHHLQPDLPIIVVTASPTWGRARSLFRAGAADYTRKSFDINKIINICKELLACLLVGVAISA